MLKIKDFNKLINPDNKAIYIPLYNKKPEAKMVTKTFEEITQLTFQDPQIEIGILLQDGFTVINIDDKQQGEMILNIIKDREEKVFVVETPNGMHIYGRTTIGSNTRNNILIIGAKANVLTEDIGRTYVVTPFKNPKTNKNQRLDGYKELYFNGIEQLPTWLEPIYNTNVGDRFTTINFPTTINREQALIDHLQQLKFTRLNGGQRSVIIEMINDYLMEPKLSTHELFDQVLNEHNEDTLPESTFFKGMDFLHHKMGDYMIEYVNAKKDRKSGKLYYYSDRETKYDSDEDYLKGVITKLTPTLKDFQKNEVIKHMKSKLSLSSVKFDEEAYHINFKNGVLDLMDMKLYPHSSEFLETIRLNVNYKEHESHETADKFFHDATQGEKDLETLLYEAIGYSMLKTASLEKIFMLTGSGRNGKSTYFNLIREIVGQENATSVDFKELNTSFGTGGLAGKLVSLAGDISSKRIDDSDIVKKVASGDLLRINEKYEKQYDAVPFTTFFLSANKLPQSNDTTYAFYRRFSIIPFNANLDEVSKVQGAIFQKKLLSEESKEYVAFKAVQAIWKVLNTTEEFTEPQSVKDMLEKYRISNSSVLEWLYESQTKPEDFNHRKYDVYKNWCFQNGRHEKAYNNFLKELEDEFKMTFNKNKGRFE